MNFLRKYWYDLGGFLAVAVAIFIGIQYGQLSHYQLLMWVSLGTLFLHQLEEYRVVGTFPGMINTHMFHSEQPDRYPLNTNTSLVINVFIGWTLYALAALFAERAIWLGMASILVSVGNVMAHTFLFNIKGKTIYNAGMASSWLLFAPCAYFFFHIIYSEHLVTVTDYLIGIPLGIVINVVGILKLIDWLADKNTSYAFENRHLLPKDRNKNTP